MSAGQEASHRPEAQRRGQNELPFGLNLMSVSFLTRDLALQGLSCLQLPVRALYIQEQPCPWGLRVRFKKEKEGKVHERESTCGELSWIHSWVGHF